MLLLEREPRCDGRRVGGVQESCPFGMRFGKVPVGCWFGRERGEVGSAGGSWGKRLAAGLATPGRWRVASGWFARCLDGCVGVGVVGGGWRTGADYVGRAGSCTCRFLVDDSKIFHMYRLGGKRHRITLARCRFRLSSSGGEGFHGTARAASNVTERIATYLRGGPKKADQPAKRPCSLAYLPLPSPESRLRRHGCTTRPRQWCNKLLVPSFSVHECIYITHIEFSSSVYQPTPSLAAGLTGA